MGGSLGLALKDRGFDGVIKGYARRHETCEDALRRRMVDEAFDDPVKAVEGVDLAVLCVPILSMAGLVSRIKTALKPGCLLTDVGSTKEEVDAAIRSELSGSGVLFIGSHPIAGSEQQGLAFARKDLYENAVCILTPRDGDPDDRVGALSEFWKRAGAQVHVLSPADHDRIMARTSHLPHLAAAVLAATVGRENAVERLGPFCGPGFRDTTRVAQGSSEVWHDIVKSNRTFILSELGACKKMLEELTQLVMNDDSVGLQRFLENSREIRRSILASRRMEGNQGL